MNDSTSAVIPLKGAQRMIADRMHKSLAETAQLTFHAQCQTLALTQRRGAIRDAGGKASILDLLSCYVATTLVDHPILNATLEDGEIRLHEAVNLGIAISLGNGALVAPALFNVQAMTLEMLSAARTELTTRARTGKLSVEEMVAGTFTVSNLGLTRVKYFTPILNIPQVAILGIGGVEKRLVETEDGTVEGRDFMGLSLTFDHRAVNGAPAAAFLDALCDRIERAPAVR